jgi:hypothetical protein
MYPFADQLLGYRAADPQAKPSGFTVAAESGCHSRRRKTNARTGSSALFAPFCPLAFLLSPDQSGRWLVGAVGIEPTTYCFRVGSKGLPNPVATRSAETATKKNRTNAPYWCLV